LPETSSHYRFTAIRHELLSAGIASRHIERTIQELRDHLEDIQAEAGSDPVSAEDAARRLGDPRLLAQQIAAHEEFRSWIYRFPRVARVCLPIAYLLLLPAVPLRHANNNAAAVARWSAALFLGAAVTSATLLLMQLSIQLT